jgi:hypothetical protein
LEENEVSILSFLKNGYFLNNIAKKQGGGAIFI